MYYIKSYSNVEKRKHEMCQELKSIERKCNESKATKKATKKPKKIVKNGN